MTDEDIQKAWRDIGGADGRMILPLYEFARAIIAQARAEFIAELQPVAWADKYALNLLHCGYHAAVSPQQTNNATRALAVIPDTKEPTK